MNTFFLVYFYNVVNTSKQWGKKMNYKYITRGRMSVWPDQPLCQGERGGSQDPGRL